MTDAGRPVAAWYPDPSGRHQHRYWDGDRWTVHVANEGVTAIDGGAPRPVVEQPVVQHPVVQEPVVQQPQWQPTPSPAWQTASVAPTPVRSSAARVWVMVIAFAVAIGGIGLTAMLALGRDDDSGTSAASSGQRFPTVVETNFMTGCTGSGGNTSYCRCALDHLEQDYDLGEFAQAEQSFTTTGKLPDSMMNAVRDCVHYLLPQQ